MLPSDYVETFRERVEFENNDLAKQSYRYFRNCLASQAVDKSYLGSSITFFKGALKQSGMLIKDNDFGLIQNSLKDVSIIAKGLYVNLAYVGDFPSEELFKDRFRIVGCKELALTIKKNADYTGQSGDSFSNFRLSQDLEICDIVRGVLVRMCDKISRLQSFKENGEYQVKDESLFDTTMDLAIYSKMLWILIDVQAF